MRKSEGSCMWVGAYVVCTFLQYQRRGFLNFLRLSGYEAEEGKGVVGLEIHQWSSKKWSQSATIHNCYRLLEFMMFGW